MIYSFPTAAAAAGYLASSGWTNKGDYFTKPTVRGDNTSIPAAALVRIKHNRVDPSYGKPDYFTVNFI
jgi:membrane-bound lytic murein transglycosylase B